MKSRSFRLKKKCVYVHINNVQNFSINDFYKSMNQLIIWNIFVPYFITFKPMHVFII